MEHPSSDQSTASVAQCPRAGLLLFDRYEILGIIGQGGMGTVFKAYHRNLKRPVAIKTIRMDHGGRPHAVQRFLREMELVGQMDHPNIVRATDGGEKNGVYYLVMEYLEGSDLDHLVRRFGKLAPADACSLIHQAAIGLAHAHDRLVHRDIKPSNLWLTTAGVVKVLDLGLARHISIPAGEETPPGCAVGTYDFLAPEQAAGRDVDGRADIYSLGATLFKLLLGHAPFSGPGFESPAEKFHAHRETPITLARGFTRLPREVGAVIERMMAKDPDQRYPSSTEVAAALKPLCENSDVGRLVHDAAPESFRPLPTHLPDDLGRLTLVGQETPVATDVRSKTPPSTVVERRPWRRAMTVGIVGTVAMAMAFLPWWRPWHRNDATNLVPDALPIVSKGVASGPVDLDRLSPFTTHRLLEQRPLALGLPRDENRRWRWEEREGLLDVRGPGSLLFPLGKSTRLRWTFEVGITQTPWTGKIGVFWGLHRNAAAESARERGTVFATFQMLLLERKPGVGLETVFSAKRGKGTLKLNAVGEPILDTVFTSRHDLPRLSEGERVMAISIDGQRLRRAIWGAVDLASVVHQSANSEHASDLYDGELGVIAWGHSATFTNARFNGQSEQ